MGMFYVGYLSSFWIRLRALGVIPSDVILGSAAVPAWLTRYAPDLFTQGAVVTWCPLPPAPRPPPPAPRAL
jgi:hypothetical protein